MLFNRELKSSPSASGSWDLILEKNMYGSQWRETTYLFILSELCPCITHMMFVNLKDNSESQKLRSLS